MVNTQDRVGDLREDTSGANIAQYVFDAFGFVVVDERNCTDTDFAQGIVTHLAPVDGFAVDAHGARSFCSL